MMQDIRFAQRPLVRRLRLKNYKSIGDCDIKLGTLAILVGPNGSGKSNVIDSLRFVTDALRDNLDLAFRNRGGDRSGPAKIYGTSKQYVCIPGTEPARGSTGPIRF
jgi:predicted ATP-binding protein involved in virulence